MRVTIGGTLLAPPPFLRWQCHSHSVTRILRQRKTNIGVPSKARRSLCVHSFRLPPPALSAYNPSLVQKKQSLFETCLTEVVSHLDEAPFLQTLQVLNGNLFHRCSVANEQVELDKDSDVFILCQSVPKQPARCCLPHAAILAGKVDGCTEGGVTASSNEEAETDGQFWGLIVKSEMFPEMQGCYLMRTTTSGVNDSLFCTHYSVTRICTGVPLADQYDASWLV